MQEALSHERHRRSQWKAGQQRSKITLIWEKGQAKKKARGKERENSIIINRGLKAGGGESGIETKTTSIEGGQEADAEENASFLQEVPGE